MAGFAKPIAAWGIVVLLVIIGIFANILSIMYCIVPIDRPYTTAGCDIYSCKETNTSLSGWTYYNTKMDIGMNGYNKSVDTVDATNMNYCNSTVVVCYYYDDDITSLTIHESDVKYTGMPLGGAICLLIFLDVVYITIATFLSSGIFNCMNVYILKK